MRPATTSGTLVVILSSVCWSQDSPVPLASTARPEAQYCIGPAARHHHVNPSLLRAILKVESNLNPRVVGRNVNGTIDVGIGQINSRNFSLLAAYGIQPAHLLDPCIGSYVAAWHLSKVIALHGNTWEAVARYHSGTPYFNRRYRILLNNELVAAGVLSGPRLPVPALRPGDPVSTRSHPDGKASADTPAVILDQPDAATLTPNLASAKEAGPPLMDAGIARDAR
jgi:hypothetical protein